MISTDEQMGALTPPPLPRYARQMALDWPTWRNGLPSDKRVYLDETLHAFPEMETGVRHLTNIQWISENTGIPPAQVARNYDIALRGAAEKFGWGDAGKDTSSFYAKVRERSLGEQAEEWQLRGMKDNEAPMVKAPAHTPELPMGLDIHLPWMTVPETTRNDTEAAKKSRQESLLVTAYGRGAKESAAPEEDDKVRFYQEWVTAHQKDLISGNEEKYWNLWSRYYDAGRADLEKAEAAGEKMLPFLSRRTEVYGSEGINEALKHFMKLSPDQRPLAVRYMSQQLAQEGKRKELGILDTEGGWDDTGKAFVRFIDNTFENLQQRSERLDINKRRVQEGDVIATGGDRSPEAIVNSAVLERAHGPNIMDPEAKPLSKITVTKAEADAANALIDERLGVMEAGYQLRQFSQDVVTGLKREKVPDVIAQTTAESLAAMTLIAIPGAGPALAFENYSHQAYNEALREGLTRGQAEATSPFIGAMQAAADYVSFGWLKKNPIAEGVIRKWSSGAMRAVGRLGGITVAETGAELFQDTAAEAFVRDFASAMDPSIPGTDWSKVGRELVKTAPEVMTSMIILSSIGVGSGHLSDVKNVDALTRNPEALRWLGFREDQIGNVVYASNGKAGEVFMEEFARRDITAPGDHAKMAPAGAAELASGRSATPSPTLPDDESPFDEGRKTAVEQPSFLDQVMEDQFPEATPEQRERLKQEMNEGFLAEEAQNNEDAEVARVFRDTNGWHIEMLNGGLITGGSLEATLHIRDEMARKNLAERAAEAEKAAKPIEPVKAEELPAITEAAVIPEDPFSEPTPATNEEKQTPSKQTQGNEKEVAPKEWAKTLPSTERENSAAYQSTLNETPYEGDFVEGELTADPYGDDPYIYRNEYINPNDFREILKLEGLTYEQVVQMPSTQRYIQWYKEGKIPPPVDIVLKAGDKSRYANNRRRLVAAIEAGVTRIPARVEIGKASEVMPKIKQPPASGGQSEGGGESVSAASSETPATRSIAPDTLNQSVSPSSNVNPENPTNQNEENQELRQRQQERQTLLTSIDEAETSGEQEAEPADTTIPPEPPASETAESPLPSDTVSIKNAAVDADRAKKKLPPLMEPLRRAWGVVWDEAMRIVAADGRIPGRLVLDLRAVPRVITDTEHALLLYHYATLSNTYDELLEQENDALEAGNTTLAGSLSREKAKISEQIGETGDITKMAGTNVARSLAIRRMEITRDFNIHRIKQELRNAQGGKLSEEQDKKIDDTWEELSAKKDEALKKAQDDADVQFDAEVEAFAEKLFGIIETTKRDIVKNAPKGRTVREILKDKSDEARKRLKEKAAQKVKDELEEGDQKLYSGPAFDADDLADLVTIAAHRLAQGVGAAKDLGAWLIKEFGDAIKPFVKSIAEQAQVMLEGLKETEKSPAAVMGQAQARAELSAAEGGEGAKPKQSDVYYMARAHVLNGVHGVDNIMAATHKSLKEFFPGLTEREVRDIFSGYGKRIFPSKEDIARELREVRQLVLLERQLDDLMEGKAPQKTGPQRDAPTDEIRAKQKQVRDLRRKLDLETTSPEGRIKSSLDAVITRLKNEIADLEKWTQQPGGRTKDQREPRKPLKYNEEATALLARRDELRKALAEIEGTKEKTPEERAKAVLNGLAKLEEELTRRIVAGEWVRAKKPGDPISNDEIETKRSLIAAMREAIKEQADNYKTHKTPVFKALDRAQKALDHWTAVMEGAKAQKTPQTSRALSQAEEDIKLQIAAMREVLAQEKRDAKRKPEEQKQYEQAERTLKNLEDVLTGAKQPKGKAAPKDAQSERVEETRAQILTAKEALKELRESYAVRNSQERQDIAAHMGRLKGRITALETRIKKKDFGPRKKKDYEAGVPEIDNERLDLEYRVRQLQEELTKGIFEARLAARTPGRRVFDAFREILTTARAFATSFDVSAVLRQGGFVVLGHPVRAAKGIPTMFKSFLSEKERLRAETNLKERENFRNGLYAKSGLEILTSGQLNLAKMEEAYMGRWVAEPPKWVDKVPVLKQAFGGVRGSARAYSTFLNQLRADSFDVMVATLTAEGKNPTLPEARSIAHYVNVATGRGVFNSAEMQKASVALNTIFFAPKYVWSRFQLLFGTPFWSAEKSTKKLVAMEYFRYLAGLMTMYGLYSLFHMGDDDDRVEFDPRSAKFGKLKFGNTFVDPLSGLGQNIVFMTLVEPFNSTYKTGAGEFKPLDPHDPEHGPYDKTKASIIGKFLLSKLSPFASSSFSGLSEEDYEGKKTGLFREYGSMWIPMSGKDAFEAWREEGVIRGTPLILASLLGMSVQTYTDDTREKISNEDQNWLYNHELTLSRIGDSSKDSGILGSKKGVVGKPIPESERKALLVKSEPGVTKAVHKARESAKDLPKDKEQREAKLGSIQKTLERDVRNARKAALREIRK